VASQIQRTATAAKLQLRRAQRELRKIARAVAREHFLANESGPPEGFSTGHNLQESTDVKRGQTPS
jgi:hypothetical protein